MTETTEKKENEEKRGLRKEIVVETMCCYRPKHVERCNGTQCPYKHSWEVQIKHE